jgi:hydrogenase-4 membrane subunit HyfE
VTAAFLQEVIPNLAGAAMLLLGLLLPLRERVEAAGRLVAPQGGLLALAAGSAAWGGAGWHLWFLALGALVGRALLLPAMLRLATGGGRGRGLPHGSGRGAQPPAVSAVAFLLAGGGLAVLAAAAVLPTGPGLDSGMRGGLALALAALLAGLLATVPRRAPLRGLLGLFAAENGALLAVVHAGEGMPGAAALAVLSPGLVTCFALAARARGGASSLNLWAAARR